MTPRIARCTPLVAAVLAALLALLWFFTRTVEYSSEQFLMDTLVSIRVHGRDKDRLQQGVTAAFSEMRRIADMADRFPKHGTAAFRESDVCRINENAGITPVKVRKEVVEMLALARKGHDLSDGAFDATIGPVMDLWGFGNEHPRVPQPGLIEAGLKLVADRDLVIDGQQQTVFLRRQGMTLDLGAVAKGYATEKALQVLKDKGIGQALIDAGGNIRVLGKNGKGSPWKIGIRDPRKADGLVAILSLEDESAVTSGDYFRFFEENGKRWHHILDPKTGYPARENMSVTVITRDAGLADVLSTALFVLPPEKALATAEKMEGVELFLVTSNGRVLHTGGLRNRIEVTAGTGYSYEPGR